MAASNDDSATASVRLFWPFPHVAQQAPLLLWPGLDPSQPSICSATRRVCRRLLRLKWELASRKFCPCPDEISRLRRHSIPGIILACVSLVVMPILSRAKKDVGQRLGSAAMKADAKQPDFCTPVGPAAGRSASQCDARMVVGRPDCCPDHGSDHRERRH